ncbi:hypothetical protein P175DRAFT_0494281 [Aspergillus ochraceoroseus IBT 24754]|uniref:HNH nuclease domain-containing protein n=1 Tax=Aspergillus ochraceoroseus IBT 24754 TaxID=1392256 RepID=A0A2T5LS63_9EURO|nr:uncharacterized protein P175DRAFT_0494281 [Aspergillus ochraceoroseus IBT 24754]PTU19127.1 hypothetical protein P175DRAFT_0494281 [Aspergillus ochraceoroseus IBT 24754]
MTYLTSCLGFYMERIPSSNNFSEQDVAQHYSANDPEDHDMTWCHVLAMLLPSSEIKAAHLVPKRLSGDETSFLFVLLWQGASSAGWMRAPLLLLRFLEQSLHRHVDVLKEQRIETRHRERQQKGGAGRGCTYYSTRSRTVWVGPYTPGDREKAIVRLEDIDKKELTFLGDNQPAHRYLFFRFIISYLYAKANGNTMVREKVNRKDFWPIIGRYLHKSMLVTLARSVSGTELPRSLVEGKTLGT